MSNRKFLPNSTSRQAGFTLIELMVSLGLSGVVFMVMMTLMGQSATFSAIFHGGANAVEAVSTTISQLNNVMPQIVRINTCGCRGAESSSLSNCTWSEASPWYDPHYNGGVASSNQILLEADFESFYGGNNTQNTTQLERSNLPAGFGSEFGGCDSTAYASLSNYRARGCKHRLRLYYTPPTLEAGGVPSKAGSFWLWMGNQVGKGVYSIGAVDKNGMSGIGVSELSCGFQSGTGGSGLQSGLLFVLNMKVRSRTTTLQDPANSLYESWYKGGLNYGKGVVRELRLKYSLPNLAYRGMYQWRSLGKRNCTPNGSSSGSAEECCSLAWSGTSCVACIASGQPSTTATACCSERLSGGNCK